MNVDNKEFHYYPNEEKLIVYTSTQPGPELLPVSRDRFGNPYFNLDREEKSHGIQMGKGERERGLKSHHGIIRGFLKQIEYDDSRQITTFYAKEEKKDDNKNKYIFTFDFRDIVAKNHRGAGAYKNKEKQPELYDGKD